MASKRDIRRTLFKRNEIRQRFGGMEEDLPWQTFTGNPLQFNAPKAHVLKSLKAYFSPKQDLHGYDAPWPAGGGANIFDKDATQITSLAGIDFTKVCYCSANVAAAVLPGVTVIGFSSGCQALGIPVKNGDVVKIYFFNGTASTDRRMYVFTDSSGNLLESRTQYTSTTAATINVTYDAYMFLEWAIGTDVNDGIVITKNETAVQTKWTPYSNECPISGWTWLTLDHTGANVFSYDATKATTGTTTEGTTRAYYPLGLSNCILSFSAELVGSSVTSSNINIGKLVDGKLSILNGFITQKQIIERTFTFAENEEAVFMASDTSAASITLNFPKYNICVALGSTASPYSPYQGRTVSVTWQDEAGTVYGGYLLFYEDGSVDLVEEWETDDLGTLTWIAMGQASYRIFRASTPNVKTASGTVGLREALCSRYALASSGSAMYNGSEDNVFLINSSYLGGQGYTYVRDSAYNSASADEFKAAMSGVQVSYMIENPVIYHLPSLEEAIRCFKGINTMWTDGDSLTVEARAESVQLNALQSLNMLLGGRYVNNHTDEDLSDEEAFDIILNGGNER